MSPIQRLIRLNPVPAVIRTVAPEGYEPADEDDYVPGTPVDTWLYGAYSGVKSDGKDFTATLTVETIPELTSTESSRVILEEGEYGIRDIHPRRLRGQISGYTLELEQ